MVEFIRSHAAALPHLAKFALGMMIIWGVPLLSRRVRLPGIVGLLLSGVVIGPYVLGIFGQQRPLVDFFADLGKLLLMFVAGLEIDLAHFRQAQGKSIMFGLITTGIPLLLGTAVGLLFGYGIIASIVIGSLLASHTLLGLPIVARLGANRLEPITITVGATILSDTLSLVVFAVCVSTYESGFSVAAVTKQLVEIAVFVPVVLFGLSRLGAYALKKVEAEEAAYFASDVWDHGGGGRSRSSHQPPRDSRSVPCRVGGQRFSSRQACKREAGILWKFFIHPDLLLRNRILDRPGCIRPDHN